MSFLLVDPEVGQGHRQKQLDGAPLPVRRPPVAQGLVVARRLGLQIFILGQLVFATARECVAASQGTQRLRAEDASQLLRSVADLSHRRDVELLLLAISQRCLLTLCVEDACVLLRDQTQHEVVGVLVLATVFLLDRPRHVPRRLLVRKRLVEGHRRAQRGHGVAQPEEPMAEEQGQADFGVHGHPGDDPPKWRQVFLLVKRPDAVQLSHGMLDGALRGRVQATRQHLLDAAQREALHKQRGPHQGRARELRRHLVLQTLLKSPFCAQPEACALSGPSRSALALLEVHPPGPDHRVVRQARALAEVRQLHAAGVDDHRDIIDGDRRLRDVRRDDDLRPALGRRPEGHHLLVLGHP
mmetsp:Transcript_69860/g.200238  ORF Transcript_69860/g.200238 Transcript_69860/m.200238 type:complete len:355 (+) Transcript_69860:726-1790(+)